MTGEPRSPTQLLARASGGDNQARDEFYQLVYRELTQIANRHVASWEGKTIQANDLVHEAFVKLIPSMDREWSDRGHFFAVASRAMRQVLIGYARKKMADKRGGGQQVRLTLSGLHETEAITLNQLISLGDALDRLELLNPRLRQVVDMRFFAGMDEERIAEVLEVSARTVVRDWVKAKMYLHRELFPDDR